MTPNPLTRSNDMARFKRRDPDADAFAILPTAREAADRLDVSESTAQRWFNGEVSPRLANFAALVRAYDLTPNLTYAWLQELERRRTRAAE